MSENRQDNRQIKFRVSVPAFAKKLALGYRMTPPKVDKAGAIEIAKQLRAIGNNVN